MDRASTSVPSATPDWTANCALALLMHRRQFLQVFTGLLAPLRCAYMNKTTHAKDTAKAMPVPTIIRSMVFLFISWTQRRT